MEFHVGLKQFQLSTCVLQDKNSLFILVVMLKVISYYLKLMFLSLLLLR